LEKESGKEKKKTKYRCPAIDSKGEGGGRGFRGAPALFKKKREKRFFGNAKRRRKRGDWGFRTQKGIETPTQTWGKKKGGGEGGGGAFVRAKRKKKKGGMFQMFRGKEVEFLDYGKRKREEPYDQRRGRENLRNKERDSSEFWGKRVKGLSQVRWKKRGGGFGPRKGGKHQSEKRFKPQKKGGLISVEGRRQQSPEQSKGKGFRFHGGKRGGPAQKKRSRRGKKKRIYTIAGEKK